LYPLQYSLGQFSAWIADPGFPTQAYAALFSDDEIRARDERFHNLSKTRHCCGAVSSVSRFIAGFADKVSVFPFVSVAPPWFM
jgi:hypothetical protein